MENNSSPKSGTGFLKTCFNGVNALSGVGILSIPYALSQGGWLSSVIFLTIAIICFYTGILLQRCIDSSSLIKTYPDIGELAFGRKGRIIVAIFLYLELYLVAVDFLILEGDNLEKLFPNANFHVAGLKIGSKQGFVLIFSLLVLPTTWLRSLNKLAYVGVGGVLASVILIASVLGIGAFDGVGFHEKGVLVKWSGVPTAMSLYAFCFSGHAVFPMIYTGMKNRKTFHTVLLVCFVICTLGYGLMGAIGYLMYGESLRSQVTLNLPSKNIGSKIAIYTTLINPFTKFALLITPIAEAIEDSLHVQKNRTVSVFIRTALVVSTTMVALVDAALNLSTWRHHNATHEGRSNKYSFVHHGKHYILKPMSASSIKADVFSSAMKKASKTNSKPRTAFLQGREDDAAKKGSHNSVSLTEKKSKENCRSKSKYILIGTMQIEIKAEASG